MPIGWMDTVRERTAGGHSVIAERLTAALADRYRIERELGQGGMATVYLAHDIRHGRDVAIKVLHPDLGAALGAERFLSEIRTTARLQHPHILPLLDSGEADGLLYYVMPLVTGETLRSRLEREQQLPIGDAVLIAREVADALGYAHGLGVIHRDIKPENILLQGGHALVADFGIALAVQQAGGQRMTQTGLSLGTPQYMSPEQGMGERAIDSRSDIYALGAVTYEMLVGEAPFTGPSVQAIVAKIMTARPAPLHTLRDTVPAHIEQAVLVALAKLPADRFESAMDFADALAGRGRTLALGSALPARATVARDWRRTIAIPALVFAAVMLGAVAWLSTRPAPDPKVSRYEIALNSMADAEFANLAVSPDGDRLVSVVSDRDGSNIIVRQRDELDPTVLVGSQGGYNPVFSPDGRRLAFMSGATIRTIDIAGGISSLVTDSLVGVPGLAWGHDGYIYYDRRGVGPLVRVRETGGAPELVSTLDSAAGERQHVWPDPLPNGRGVLMVVNRGGPGHGGTETDGIAVLDLEAGTHRELFRGVYVRYAHSGHLLYVTHDGDLFGAPFDQDRLEVTGPAVVLAQGLSVSAGGTGSVGLTISRDGTLWYLAGGQGTGRRELVWAARDGAITPFESEVAGDIQDIALAPDGVRLAFVMRGADGGHVWVTREGSANRDRVTFQGAFNSVSWHPDGRTLLMSSVLGELASLPADGSAGPTPIPVSNRNVADARWSPDGRWLTYTSPGRSNLTIFGLRPGVDSEALEFPTDPGLGRAGSVSPDGRWLLYHAEGMHDRGVFVRPFPDTEGNQRQVSPTAGRDPRWSADGREIFYRSASDSLLAVPVVPGPGFSTGSPRALFSLRGVAAWDIAPNGKRFLLVRAIAAAAGRRLIVVENFHEELKARMLKK